MLVISAFEKWRQEDPIRNSRWALGTKWICGYTRPYLKSEKKKHVCMHTGSTHAGNLKCGQYTFLSDIIDFSFAQGKPIGWRGWMLLCFQLNNKCCKCLTIAKVSVPYYYLNTPRLAYHCGPPYHLDHRLAPSPNLPGECIRIIWRKIFL